MVQGWHFTETDRLANGDGRPIILDEWLEWPAPKLLVLCSSGLHLSERALDALVYATGPIAWRVEADGEMLRAPDKLVCRRRRAVARVDATALLRRFARACALDVAHLWEPPTIALRYLVDGDDTMRAAASAVWATAEDAAVAWAASAASASAAWVAWAAAKGAAWAAAWATARAAVATATEAAWMARAAASDAQNTRLESWLLDATEGRELPLAIAPDEIAEPAREVVRRWRQSPLPLAISPDEEGMCGAWPHLS